MTAEGARGRERDRERDDDGDALVSPAWVVRAVAAVGRHPSLWVTGARQALVLAAPGWWRRRPFLPLPSRDYLRFRLQTAYGGDGSRDADPEDLVTYLRWCRDFGARTAGAKWRPRGPSRR